MAKFVVMEQMERDQRERERADETARLPDLPGLEEVRTTDFGTVPVLLYAGGVVTAIVPVAVVSLIRYREFMGAPGVAAAMLLIGLVSWVVLRLLLGFCSFSTSRKGLTMRRPIGRRFVAWTEIRGLSINTTKAGTTTVTLDVHGERIKLVPRGLGGSAASGLLVTASIWQHLRQTGCADGFALPEDALRLWKPVPEDVPLEAEWEKPPHKFAKVGRWLGTGFFVLMAAVPWWAFAGKGVFGVLFAAPMSAAMLLMFRMLIYPEMTLRACHVLVREGSLVAENARGSAYLAWTEVASADWVRTYLRIRAVHLRREVWIRFATGDRESENLILAAVRHLREKSNIAIVLPVCISREPEALNKVSLSSEGQQALRRAYLNTLDEPVRKRLRRLYSGMIWSIIVGMLLGMALTFSDSFGHLSRLIHASGTRQFVSMDSIALGVPWIMSCVVLFGVLGEVIYGRLAGPYREEWRKLTQIGSSPKASKVMPWIGATIVGLTLIFTIAGMGCYARTTGKGFAINDFFGFGERFHSWSQVRMVYVERRERVHDGHTCWNNVYRVAFTDGSDWRFDETLVRCSRRDELQKAIEFIASKSGKPVDVRSFPTPNP